MSQIVEKIGKLFREAEGLPPFRRDQSGVVDGWPPAVMADLSEVISALVRSSTQELCEAILEIEDADHTRLPDGLLTLLARVAWDSPASPDPVRVLSACQRGVDLRDALMKPEPQA